MDGSGAGAGESTSLIRFPVTHGLVVAITCMGILASAPDSHITEMMGHVAARIWLGEPWRLLTSLAVSTNPLQMLGCGVFVGVAASYVETRLGGGRLLLIYVLGGVAGGITSLLVQESCWSEMSCGVVAVLSAALVLLARQYKDPEEFEMVVVAHSLIGLGILAISNPVRGCTHAWGIMGGFAAGFLCALVLGRKPAWELTGVGICTVVMALTTSFALQCSPQRIAEYFYSLGNASYRVGDYTAARERWTQSLAWDDGLVDAHCNLALIYLHRRDLKAYERELLTALHLSPSHPDVLTQLGALCLKDGRAAQAEKYYRPLTVAEPRLVSPWLGLCSAQRAQHDLLGAAASLGHALELEPQNDELLFSLAVLYEEDLGDAQQALQYWKPLAQRDGDTPMEAYRTARACMAVCQPQRADGIISLALRHRSPPANQPALLKLRASARAEVGLFAAAVGDLDLAAVLTGSDSWPLLYQKARLLMWWRRSGSHGEIPRRPVVRQAFETCLASARGMWETALTRGFMALQSDTTAGVALAEYSARQALRERPRDAEGSYLLGLALERKGDRKAAHVAFAHAAHRELSEREYCDAAGTPWPPPGI